MLGLSLSLFLAIAGSTVLNMWWDRDIDAKMGRTQKRVTSTGLVSGNEVLTVGLMLSVIGVGWAVAMDALYGLVVFAGLFFDVVVYSMWLKRRTCWSIVWGGISGAMPILAGRVLGLGSIDWIGVMLALGVLLWIPTHTLTFSMKFAKDYASACVPTFPSTYGTGSHPRHHRHFLRAGGGGDGHRRLRHRHGLGLPAPARRALCGIADAGICHHLQTVRTRQFWLVQVCLHLHAGGDDFGCA